MFLNKCCRLDVRVVLSLRYTLLRQIVIGQSL